MVWFWWFGRARENKEGLGRVRRPARPGTGDHPRQEQGRCYCCDYCCGCDCNGQGEGPVVRLGGGAAVATH